MLGIVLLEVGIKFYKRCNHVIVLVCLFIFSSFLLHAQTGVIRAGLQTGVSIVCRPSYQIFLECSAVPGKPLPQILYSVLLEPAEAQKYTNLRAVAIPLNRVRTSLYPQIFMALFEQDRKDNEGWWHTVPQGHQLDDKALDLWTIALSGTIIRRGDILRHPKNAKKRLPLSTGDQIFIPSQIFTAELKEILPRAIVHTDNKSTQIVLEPIDVFDEEFAGTPVVDVNGRVATKDLRYGRDEQGEYAGYKLKTGETIYSTIIRFTDYTEHKHVLEASTTIKKRNKIANERTIKPGTEIKIPLEMLSDIYQPGNKEERRIAEEVKKEVEQIKRTKKTARGQNALKDVVVIIDPGHGGKDHGTFQYLHNIIEDEVNYDIACRLKEYLEQKTQARVYMTVKDIDQGFKTTERRTFVHDTDEIVLVTPPHNPQDSTVSANLRWLMANSIIKKEEKTKIPREKMIFLSIHCNFLNQSSIRGLMIYIPGAIYYKEIEKITPNKGFDYTRFKEGKDHQPRNLTLSQRIDAEARSKTFAQILITVARKNNIAIHNNGAPIRNVIRRSKKTAYVPSVLRNINVPTKVLLECANFKNPDDLKNMADSKWRQKMAETIAEALKVYFDP